MAFFSKPDDPSTSANSTITRDRIEAFMKARDWNYQIDSDGDVGGLWDDNIFYFLFQGKNQDILQVRGRCSRTYPQGIRPTLLEYVNEYNTERIWPKVYLREEKGEIAVYAEVSIDFEHGLDDSQLYEFLDMGIGTGCQMFSELKEKFQLTLADPVDMSVQLPDPEIP